MMSNRGLPVALGADFAGFHLKERVREHLVATGWDVLDLTPDKDKAPMYQRAGFLVGSAITEGSAFKALAFCGSGMGIHIASGKCPHVHAAVAESVEAARRAATANNCNVLAMGGFWIAPRLGMAMADAVLTGERGKGYEE